MRCVVPMLRSAVGSALVMGSALAGGKVLIVDATQPPLGSYPTVQQAIDAATEGDIVLIEAGDYPSASTISGKSLTLVGNPTGTAVGQTVRVGPITVTNVAANQKVIVRGIKSVLGFGNVPAIDLANDQGPIVLEDVNAQYDSAPPITDSPMVRISNCARVLLVRPVVIGHAITNENPGVNYPKGSALAISTSTVSVYGGILQGGDGDPAFLYDLTGFLFNKATPGGPGVLLYSGSLFVAGATILGGFGGAGTLDLATATACLPGEDGGTGIVIGGKFTSLDSTISGGQPGFSPPNCLPQGGSMGTAIQQVSGSISSFDETYRSVSVESPIHLGGTATLDVYGVGGDVFVLLLSLGPSLVWIPASKGSLLPALPAIPLVIGPLPQSGVLQLPSALPSSGLSPGIDGVELYLQGHFPGAHGGGVLSSPTATIVLR